MFLNKGKKTVELLAIVTLCICMYVVGGSTGNTSIEPCSVFEYTDNNSDLEPTTVASTIGSTIESSIDYNVEIEKNDTTIVTSSGDNEPKEDKPEIELESDFVEFSDRKIFESEKLSADMQKLVMSKAAKYDIPGELVMALCWRESGYNPKLISSTNDYGLCQINKMNFRYFNKCLGRELDYFNPADSLEACGYLLNSLVKKYGDDDWHYILMCYNMGEGGARKQVRRGVYSTKYSRFIMNKAYELGYRD